MTVVPILRGHIDKQNRQAIYIRVTDKGKRTYKRTRLKIQAEQWNGEVINHPQHKVYNQMLRKLLYETEFEYLTPVNKFPVIDFYKYADGCFKSWQHSKASETLRQYASEINSLKTFSPVLNLSLSTEWLNRYKGYLFSNGNQANTVHKKLKFVRLIIRKSYKERLIEHNPFDIFEMPKYRDPKKIYLSVKQVNDIDKFLLEEKLPTEIIAAGTWFLIGCLTALRFGDIKAFGKEKHIKNGRLIMYTSKTSEVISMPLSDNLKAYFERVEYKALPYTNVHYNRLLKAIAAGAGIKENVSSHTSRHTAAITWANSGISQEVVARLMGHKSLRTSSIYYRITNLRIDQELSKLLS